MPHSDSLGYSGLGYETQPIGGMITNPGNSILKDLSISRAGMMPHFHEEKCIHCAACDNVCPDFCFVWEEQPDKKGRPQMFLQGIDYQYCKGCLKCVRGLSDRSASPASGKRMDMRKHTRAASISIWRSKQLATYLWEKGGRRMAIEINKEMSKGTVEQRMVYESGNEMAAYAAHQINYHIMGYFPISPSTEVAQFLDLMKANGQHDIKLIPADGEHGSAGICYGASTAGGRVFNATSANGYLYMLEQMPVQSGTRFPMVMNLVCRSVSGPLEYSWRPFGSVFRSEYRLADSDVPRSASGL